LYQKCFITHQPSDPAAPAQAPQHLHEERDVKKKLKVSKKTLKNLKLTIKKLSDRKVAPLYLDLVERDRTNGSSC